MSPAIDWGFWRSMAVKPWQGVLLSLEINPDEVAQVTFPMTGEIELRHPALVIEMQPEFHRRLRLAWARPDLFKPVRTAPDRNDCEILFADFVKGALELGFDLPDGMTGKTTKAPPAAGSAAPGRSWQDEARSIADEVHATDAKVGAYRSKRDMADKVATELRKRGVNGPNGPVSGSTVMRQALQGGQWNRKTRS